MVCLLSTLDSVEDTVNKTFVGVSGKCIMNDKMWDIFNRNMKGVVHRTCGESRSRDVREFVYWLRERDLFWDRGKLLNIGIGDCEEAVLLAREGLEVTGITNSVEEAENASNLRIKAYPVDVHQLHEQFRSNFFDYIYMHDTMEHFISPMMVFTQLRRVLRMGGILAFHYPCVSDIINWTHWFITAPDLMFCWLMKFGFCLKLFRYEPVTSSEFLYIAQKVEVSEELYNKGANVILDMIRELEQMMESEK